MAAPMRVQYTERIHLIATEVDGLARITAWYRRHRRPLGKENGSEAASIHRRCARRCHSRSICCAWLVHNARSRRSLCACSHRLIAVSIVYSSCPWSKKCLWPRRLPRARFEPQAGVVPTDPRLITCARGVWNTDLLKKLEYSRSFDCTIR